MMGHLIVASLADAALDGQFLQSEGVSAFIDEAHRFPVAALERIIQEGRKFKLSLVLATQSLATLEPSLADAATGVGVKVAFRQSNDSASRLAGFLDLSPLDLIDLPDLTAYIKVIGAPTCAFTADMYEDLDPAGLGGAPSEAQDG
jgi:DNA helicase HerA-like ATPase